MQKFWLCAQTLFLSPNPEVPWWQHEKSSAEPSLHDHLLKQIFLWGEFPSHKSLRSGCQARDWIGAGFLFFPQEMRNVTKSGRVFSSRSKLSLDLDFYYPHPHREQKEEEETEDECTATSRLQWRMRMRSPDDALRQNPPNEPLLPAARWQNYLANCAVNGLVEMYLLYNTIMQLVQAEKARWKGCSD